MCIRDRNKAGELTEDDLKDLENEMQKLTDKYIKTVDKSIEDKSKEILTV